MSDALAHASEGGHSVQSTAADDEEIGACLSCLPDERFDRGPLVDGHVCRDGANRIELESHPFALRQLVEEALDFVALKAQERRVEVVYEIAPGVPEGLRGDSGRLRQILEREGFSVDALFAEL